MPQPLISLTESQCLAALRAYLLAVLPGGYEVIQGLDNRVPEPAGANFVLMTPMLRERIETNTDTYPDTTLGTGTMSSASPVRMTVQLDVHGPASADNAQIITQLYRDDWAVQQFASSGFDVQPLYCGEPHQIPYENDQQQIERRWIIDAVMQANPVIQVPQQFAATLKVGLIDVDATFPP